jgi:cytochrome b subunit of formate dehydrogenase
MTDFCYYHPSKEAVTKCNRCGKPMCRDDSQAVVQIKTSYTKRYYQPERQYQHEQSAYYRYYCIPCNTTRIIQQRKSMKATVILFWVIAMIGVVFTVTGLILKQYIDQIDLDSYSQIIQVILAVFVVIGGGTFNIFVVIVFIIIAIFLSCNLKNISRATEQALQVQATFDTTVIKKP